MCPPARLPCSSRQARTSHRHAATHAQQCRLHRTKPQREIRKAERLRTSSLLPRRISRAPRPLRMRRQDCRAAQKERGMHSRLCRSHRRRSTAMSCSQSPAAWELSVPPSPAASAIPRKTPAAPARRLLRRTCRKHPGALMKSLFPAVSGESDTDPSQGHRMCLDSVASRRIHPAQTT